MSLLYHKRAKPLRRSAGTHEGTHRRRMSLFQLAQICSTGDALFVSSTRGAAHAAIWFFCCSRCEQRFYDTSSPHSCRLQKAFTIFVACAVFCIASAIGTEFAPLVTLADGGEVVGWRTEGEDVAAHEETSTQPPAVVFAPSIPASLGNGGAPRSLTPWPHHIFQRSCQTRHSSVETPVRVIKRNGQRVARPRPGHRTTYAARRAVEHSRCAYANNLTR